MRDAVAVTVWLLATWNDVMNHAASGGYAAALATICLLQYLAHVYGLSSSRRREERHREEITGLSNELNNLQRDRQISRYENQLLRDFVAQSDSNRALALILRRFMTNTDEGFAAFLRHDDGKFVVEQARGLSQTAAPRLTLDKSIAAQVTRDFSVTLEGQELSRTDLWASLDGTDRAKAQQLFVLGLINDSQLLGVIVTTHLVPPGIPRPQQIELAERLMLSIGTTFGQRQSFEEQQSRLHLTNEMLQLREIADRKDDNSIKMIEELVRQLTRRCHATRGALLLAPPEPGGTVRLVAEGGDPLAIGIRDVAQKHIDVLGREGLYGQDVLRLDGDALQKFGVKSLFASALVVPLVQPHATIAALVLVRSQSGGFSRDSEALARWGADHLKSVLSRAVTQAATERLAKQDGLTELANRRTFDQQLQSELHQGRVNGTTCSLLIFDLDRFKSINDRYGHRGGDLVLRAAAGVLRDKVSRVRASDRVLCARYGGEELVVLLPGFSSDGALRIAESIRVGIETLTIDMDGTTIRVTTSCGVATSPMHGTTPEELISAADSALYEAKANGRNRVLLAAGKAALVS